MSTADESLRRYSTPFQRHLSFFDRDGDGFIYFGESLRGNLAIGVDFPVAVGMAFGYHMVYGNTRPFFFGPFRGIEIAKVRSERTQLESIRIDEVPTKGLSRKELVMAAQPQGVMDRLHVNGLWAFAATSEGMISPQDIEMYKQGIMLYELEKRRKDNRDHVLPLSRGGPISVAGHSWVVDKLFGVKIYQLQHESKTR